jgi:hypothetical protein
MLVRYSILGLVICAFYAIYLYTVSISNYLPEYAALSIFAPIKKLWPYAQVFIWIINSLYILRIGCDLDIRGNLAKIVIIFLVLFLLRVMSIGVAPLYFHSAFLGYMTHVTSIYLVLKVLGSKGTLRKYVYASALALVVLIPFYGALRGATFGAVILPVVGYMLIAVGKNRRIHLGYIAIIAIGFTVTLQLFGTHSQQFAEENPYEYSHYTEVFTASLNPKTKTLQSRIDWWQEAVARTASHPINGHMMQYTFTRDPYGTRVTANGLHNFYISAFAEGGILLLLPIMYVFFVPAVKGLVLAMRGHSKVVLPLIWLLATILERITNTYSFNQVASRISAIISGYAIAKIAYIDNDTRKRGRV